MLRGKRLQEAAQIADMLQDINHKHSIAKEQKPPHPDRSPEARLFSAYDAAEAALERLREIVPASNPEHTCATPLTRPAPGQLSSELLEPAEALEELLAQLPVNYKDRHYPHVEAALGWVTQAGEYLSGTADPQDNPAPYESYENGNEDEETTT